MTMVQNWIWPGNLDPLLDELERMAGEELDEGLRRVFVDEVRESDTDSSPERWASCHFYGKNPIAAQLGIDQGTDVLFVRLDLPDGLQCRAETMLGLMQDYVLIGPNRSPS